MLNLGYLQVAPGDHWYGGLGVSLGDSKGWGVAGGLGALGIWIWATYPKTFFVVGLVPTSYTNYGPFWAILGPFVGHMVNMEVTKVLFGTSKASQSRHMQSIFYSFGALRGFCGSFERKRAVFGPKMHRFGRASPDLAPLPYYY